MTSPWLTKLPNAYQSQEERRAKYAICLLHGCNRDWGNKMRDWRWAKLARRFGFQSVGDLILATGIEVDFYLDDAELNAVIE